MMSPSSVDLEDQVFGMDSRQAEESVVSEGVVKRPPLLETPGRLVPPLIAAFVMILIVLWSLSKSVQYNELFQTSSRYQYALWALNVVVIVLATSVVVCRCSA